MKITNQHEDTVPFGQICIGDVFSGSNPYEEFYIKIPECTPKGKNIICNAFNLVTETLTSFGERSNVTPYKSELILK